ncbi:MAG: hypothetical protein A2Z16_07020 [Chloroflexi bacterium RBG_16_54_18]|nr:MAG: hypothetical protein A2Z16_07020 [Chloroflexi bacterium RBG_16_54_18]
MPVHIEVSQVIGRPLEKVFHFIVHEHVRNHPRWDPDIELEQLSEGPIGMGTLIRRTNVRSGTPVEGSMQVVEFEEKQAFATLIHDGPVEMLGRISFEELGDNQTRVTTSVDFPGLDETKIDRNFMLSRLERSQQNRKQLIESEL